MPTLLQMHGQPIPQDVLGKSLLSVLQDDVAVRDAAIFGYFGAACIVTDGQHVYFRYPESMSAENLYEYTLMPTRMTSRFSISELIDATLVESFTFTKGVPLLKLKPRTDAEGVPIEVQGLPIEDTQTVLFDLHADPGQKSPVDAPEKEAELVRTMCRLMQEADAPDELFARFDLSQPV